MQKSVEPLYSTVFDVFPTLGTTPTTSPTEAPSPPSPTPPSSAPEVVEGGADADASSTPPAPTGAPAVPRRHRPKSMRQQLRSHLLDGYDRLAHPRLDPDANVTVGVGLAVIHVDLDERASTINVDAWMRLAWKDEHLPWNPQDYGGLKTLHFGMHELWYPDIQVWEKGAPYESFLMADCVGVVVCS